MGKDGRRKSLEEKEEFNQANGKEMQEKCNFTDNCAISEQVINPHAVNFQLETSANQGYKSISSPHPLPNPASSSSSSSVSNSHHLSLHPSSRKQSLMREIKRHYDGLIGEFDVKMSTNQEVGKKMKEIFHEEENEVGEREKKERKESGMSGSMEREESDQMEAAGSSSFGSGEKISVLNPDTVSNVSSSTFQTTIARQSRNFFSPPHQPFDPDRNSFNPQTDTHNFSSSSATIFDNQTPVLDSIVHEFNNTSTVEETGIEGEGRNRKNESEGEKRRSKSMEEEENGKKRSEGEGREKRESQSTPPPLLEIAPGPGADAATVEGEKRGEEVSIGVPKSLPSLSPPPHSFVPSNRTQTQQHLHMTEMTTAPVIPPTSGHHNSITENPLTGHSPAPVSYLSTQPRLSSAKVHSNATICGSELNPVKVSTITPGGLSSLPNDGFNLALDEDDVVALPVHPCPDGVSTSGDRTSADRIATWGPNSNGFLLTRTGAPASTVSAQIFKLKRFLTTLHHFAVGISPSTGQHVHELIHALVSSRITIEDFHQRIPRVTSYPLRPYVIPFLRLHLPILQEELARFYSQSQTRSLSSSLSNSQSQSRAGNHQEGINRSVISVNSSNKNSHLRQGSSNLQTCNFSNFIRSHESLFLQSVTPKSQPLINQQKLINFPKLIRGNESFEIEKKYRSGEIVQIGNNFYVGANKEPNLTAPELINHETKVDPIKLRVDKLVGEYIQRPSTNHQSPSSTISQSYQSNPAPKLIGRVSSLSEPRVVRELVGTLQVSDQRLNDQQQQPLQYHQDINQRVVDNQQSISNQRLNNSQQIVSDRQLVAMGIKEGSGEGVKRKLSSPVESRKENERIDQNTKSDHLRVSSGPRRFIPNHSPNQTKINTNQLTRLVHQHPSSTIHYLPNNSGPIAHSDCMNSGSINTRTGNTENNAKRIKVNEDLNQVSPNGRRTSGHFTNGQVSGQVSGQASGQSPQSASNDPNEPETDHEWDNIYVMLNCILGMVEKTKQALLILESRKIRQRNEGGQGSKGLTGNGSGSLTSGGEKVVSSASAAGTGFNGIVNQQQQLNNWNGIMIQEQGQQRSSRPSLSLLSPPSAPFPSSNIQNSTSGGSLLTNKVSSTLTLNNGLPSSCSSSLGATETGILRATEAGILGATALVTSSSSSATSPRSASSWPRIVSYGSAAGMTSGSFAPLSLNGTSTTVTRQQGSPSNGSGRSFTASSSFAPSNNQPSLASIHNAFIASQCLTNDQGSLVMNKNPGTSAFSSLSTFPSAAIEEFKRRTAIDALESAKVEANEIIVEERMKMERLIIEAKRKATEELMTSLNRQEDRSENCWNCGRIASDTCSGCNQARYCGSFCQHKHWDIHHKTCGKSSGRQSKSPSNISI